MGDEMTRKSALLDLLDAQATDSGRWKRKNRFYYEMIERIVRFHVPPGSSVLEIGCGTGDLLAALEPSRGVGIDIHGTRLVYPMEKQAMRFLNTLVKKSDYQRIAAGRSDFGDFDLIFGAAKLDLKNVEIPIR